MALILLPIASAYGQNVSPSDGALLYVYEAGTTTLKTVYSDIGETTPLTNPVVANASGRFPAMYISGTYKLVLKKASGPTIWTEDDLVGRQGDLIIQGDFTSSTNGGNFPSAGNQGDAYRATETFVLNRTSGGHIIHVGDLIYANKNGATGIEADWEILTGRKGVTLAEFRTSGLSIDVATTTTVAVSADAIDIPGTGGEYVQITDVDKTGVNAYSTASDAQGVLKASTWYWLWIDSSENKKMVPDLTGSADGTTAGALDDSTSEFATYGVKAGDIVFNTTDLTRTTVATTPTVDGDPLLLTDDIFVSGEAYLVRILQPTGLNAFRVALGAAYRNSSGNLDDSFYAQVQEPKYYSEAAGDFTVSGTNWTTGDAVIEIIQKNDWTGIGRWSPTINIGGTISVAAGGLTLTLTGVVFKSSSVNRTVAAWGNGGDTTFGYCTANASTIVLGTAANSTVWLVFASPQANKKPTFHT